MPFANKVAKSGIASGKKLCSVVEDGPLDPPRRKSPAHAAALIDHDHLPAPGLQRARRQQPRNPDEDDDHDEDDD